MLNTIEEALEDVKNGKPIIIVDDENRENEGDLFVAAQKASHESINMMAMDARGLTCVPMSAEWAARLQLLPMTAVNTDAKCTAFTVSADYKHGTTTGISISDRLATIRHLADPASSAEDFTRPGHIFPLTAKPRGVLEREGHTEATVDLCRLAGLNPVAVICEILNPDGTMARLPQLEKLAAEKNLKIISIEDLIAYRKRSEQLVSVSIEADMPTEYGTFSIIGFDNNLDGKEHIALVKGNVRGKENVLVRIHSECFTGDILGSRRCDCGAQLHTAMQKIHEEGEGIILYLRQEGRGIGLINKLKAYKLQEEGLDTVDANAHLGFADDLRDYAPAAQMLRALGVTSIRILTNNPAKLEGLEKYGVTVTGREAIEIPHNGLNKRYLLTKQLRMRHLLHIQGEAQETGGRR